MKNNNNKKENLINHSIEKRSFKIPLLKFLRLKNVLKIALLKKAFWKLLSQKIL